MNKSSDTCCIQQLTEKIHTEPSKMHKKDDTIFRQAYKDLNEKRQVNSCEGSSCLQRPQSKTRPIFKDLKQTPLNMGTSRVETIPIM